MIPLASPELVDLDSCVLSALELFSKEKLPRLSLGPYKRPLVVGSGNAAVTGRILFEDKDAVYADEGSYLEKLKAVRAIDGCVLFSASGGKHAPIIAREVRRRGKEVRLITNNPDAPAAKYATVTYVFPKQAEPYTYNTSTYMGMLMARTKEDPREIIAHLKRMEKSIPKDIGKYDAFYLLVPEEFDAIREMFVTKFDELFGPMVNGRVFTPEQTKHAKTVVPSDKELFISFGYENRTFGTRRFNVPLPKGASYATLMATAYYVIGHIQRQKPPYFKKNIVAYTKKASALFGQTITPLVR